MMAKAVLSGLFRCLLWIALAPTTASAVPVLDQNNPSIAGGFCYLGINGLCGQSFQQSSTNIAGAGVFIHPSWTAASGSLTISIFSSYSSTPSGLIASNTVSGVDSNSGWVDIFWAPATVTPATPYFMVIDSSQRFLVAAYSLSGVYANGNALYGGNASTYAGYDLTFRTFTDDGFVAAAAVPEPATLALLGLGLAGLGFSRRKKA